MLCDESITEESTNVLGASTLGERADIKNGLVEPSPPTKVVTVRDYFTTEDYMTLLKLAQDKFDQMRLNNRERGTSSLRYSSTRYSRHCSTSQEQTKVAQLLSSLLYLSLMMNKVDDMKQALENRDSNLYREWEGLFSYLHSPLFHLKERKLQNQRTKRIFQRKLKYKSLNDESKISSEKMNETLKEMSESISKLTNLNTLTSSKLESKCDVEKKLVVSNEQIEYLKTLLEEKSALLQAADNARESLKSSLSKSEVEKSFLTQKFDDDSSRIYDLLEENKYLKEKLEEKNCQLLIVKDQMAELEKEKLTLEASTKASSTIYETNISKLTSDLDLNLEKIAQTKIEMETMSKNHVTIVQTFEKKIEELTEKLTSSETELKTCQLELIMVKKELELKVLEVADAKEAVQIQTDHQNKWRESIALKDKEISKLYAAVKNTESKLPNSDSEREIVENRCTMQLQQILTIVGNSDEFLRRVLEEIKARESQLIKERQDLETVVANRSSVSPDFEKMMRNLNSMKNILLDLKHDTKLLLKENKVGLSKTDDFSTENHQTHVLIDSDDGIKTPVVTRDDEKDITTDSTTV